MEKKKKESDAKTRGPYKKYSEKGNEAALPRSSRYRLRSRLKESSCALEDVASTSVQSSCPKDVASTSVQGAEPQQITFNESTTDTQRVHMVDESVTYDELGIQNKDSDPEIIEDRTSELPDQTEASHIMIENSNESISWQVIPEDDVQGTNNADNDSEVSFDFDYDFRLDDDEEDKTLVDDNDTRQADNIRTEEVPHQDYDSESEDSDSDLAMAPNVNLSQKLKIKMLLLLATKKRHNLTYTAAEDIMELAGVLTPSDHPFLPTRKNMKKVIEEFSFGLKEYHVCPKCGLFIGVVNDKTFNCDKCKKSYDAAQNKKKGHVFLYLSLRRQIEALLQTYGTTIIDVKSRKKIVKTNFEDIMDGKKYKSLTGKCDYRCLTINFFVDGLQIATTSKNSAWPVLCTINELPLYLRRKNIMMASVWLGKKKPICNEYMKPFVEECKELAQHGINYKLNGERVHYKVKFLVCISDSIARPMLRNSSQFNGVYGCGLCYHPGTYMVQGKGHCRSYAMLEEDFSLRTHQEIMEHAKKGTDRVPYKGIKGLSVLADIPEFDMARGLDLDSFHALVNVAKRFVKLWFKDTYSNKPFSISDKLNEADKRILAITPTSEISRGPRSLTEQSDWRGHEWYFWIVMFSIPVLKNLLPAIYLNHWSLLVHGISLLMQNSVARSEVHYGDRYIRQFVSEIPRLYGMQNVTFSCHLLIHLKESVEDYAQPFTHSAYLYESYNSEIKDCINSSNGVIQQICKNIQLKVTLWNLYLEVADSMDEAERNFFDKMTIGSTTSPHCIVQDAALFGNPTFMKLPQNYSSAMKRSRVAIAQQKDVSYTFYERCTISRMKLCSTKYSRAYRQDNSVVLLTCNNVFMIETFVVVSNQCYAFGNYIHDTQEKLVNRSLPHMRVLSPVPEAVTRCIPVSDIECKLISFLVHISDDRQVRVACINVLKSEMLN